MQRIGTLTSILLCSFAAFAQEAPAQSPTSGLMGVLPMMIVMFIIIYFLMIRPEQKKQKSRQAMINSVQKGARVVTVGGIIGVVGHVKETTIMVKVADNTVIEVRKAAIAEVLTEQAEETSQKGAKS